ncbi:Rossmann-fold NAD(P)-binding domain-containing protein [Arcticibacter eurypsychrophilus]|uniref:hypothetical protein n=1 Tax=Arcticibacter eurypsychrophilus TaxID=1434752 RepID=UPI00084DDEA2|nr:hypothetical protein [Arcticibacter eurypsychrophilus]
MRAVAYSIRSFEKEPLAKANHKKHEITLISNELGIETAEYATGKEVVIISDKDKVTLSVIEKLAALGIKFISSRSLALEHIDKKAAALHDIKLASISVSNADSATMDATLYHSKIANDTIHNLDYWQNSKCNGDSCTISQDCESHIIAGEFQSRIDKNPER